MATEVWTRNPDNYIRECIEVGHFQYAWDRGLVEKKRIDPSRLVELYAPQGVDYRILMVGEQGTAELRRGHTMKKPFAVYPTWEYGQPLDLLEEMFSHNVGDDEAACGDRRLAADERPVLGQEHRVVAIRMPSAGTGPGRSILRTLATLQDEHPDVILHVHGLYSYRQMFGLSYRSVDTDARVLAQKGKVTLPNGKEVTFERAATTPQWIRVLGMAPSDLGIPRNRCMFNIRSALWAAEHFKENFNFASTAHARKRVDSKSAKATVPEVVATGKSTGIGGTQGDKFLCDTCSLKDNCKYFREGSVCSLPDSEPSSLASLFRSRDAGHIVDGLAALLGKQVERLERGIETEEAFEELDPAVSKLLNDVFNNGVKLAKLRNPKLNGGPAVGINLNIPPGGLGNARPAELTAAAVRAIESQGIAREDITPEMIQTVLAPALEAGLADGPDEPVEAEVVGW